MRILYVCADRGIPLRGVKGASVHVRAITAALARLGHAVTVVIAAEGTENEAPEVHRIEILQDEAPPAPDQLSKLIGAEAIEFVIERYSLQSGAARSAADAHGLPLLLEVDAPLAHEATRYRGLSNVAAAHEHEHEVFSSADVIQVVSTQLETYVRSLVPSARVHVIPNGVDYSRFATQDPVWLPHAHGRVLVGFVGSMKAWHGVMDLLEAFAAVADSPEGPLLVLAGSGPEEEKVRRRATRPDLADRVLVTGAVAHADVPALVRRLDIAVAPYANSGDFYFSPLKVLEYMAAGRPVVHPEIGDLPGLVGDGGLGYRPGDVADLAERLRQLIAKPALRRRLGAAGAERARTHTWERVADELVSLVASGSLRR